MDFLSAITPQIAVLGLGVLVMVVSPLCLLALPCASDRLHQFCNWDPALSPQLALAALLLTRLLLVLLLLE
jgi:hypothetical protein